MVKRPTYPYVFWSALELECNKENAFDSFL